MGSGFGFVTFDPKFERTGKFYTVHTEQFGAIGTKPTTYPPQPNPFIHGVVTEWTADDPDANTFVGTSREILRLGFASQIHGIQQISFNPTAGRRDEDYGLLYLAVGDGGIGVGTDVPQEMGTPYGKILRIDPNGTNGPNAEYGIPASNPFVGEPGAIGEIYALGMRDPHRFTWDSGGRHRMYLGHIGQHAIESVYEVRAGDNFGWSEREGRFVYDSTDECHLYPLPENDEEFGYVYPVAAYDHDPPPGWPCSADSGHGISGGQVYRGDLPGLSGKYVFGDLVDGRVFWTNASQMRQETGTEATIHEMQLFDTQGRKLRMTDFAEDARVDLRFGTDSQKNLYLLAKANGKVWKVVGTRTGPYTDEVVNVAEAEPGGLLRLRAPVRPGRHRRAGPGFLRHAAQAGQRREGDGGRRRRLPGQQQRPPDQAGRADVGWATTTGRQGCGTRRASRRSTRSPESNRQR